VIVLAVVLVAVIVAVLRVRFSRRKGASAPGAVPVALAVVADPGSRRTEYRFRGSRGAM